MSRAPDPPAAPRGSIATLFEPRSVAVVGASRRPGSIGRQVVANLVGSGFEGPVYPVNPSARSVHSLPCVATLADIAGPVDLVVVTVPSGHVLQVARDAAAVGARAMVVITAGFREVGAEGRATEEELVRVAKAAGIRIVGPNCMGLINTDPAYHLNASFAASSPPRGGVAFASQSGALGEAILETAADLGLGLSTFVSLGNKADVSGNDLLEYWADDPATKLVLLYLESFGNPRRFGVLARRLTRERRKPILAVKSGRTRLGAAAASSHTGALAGTDAAVDSLFQQCGITRATTVNDLFTLARAFASQPVPRGRRTAILTNAGGPGIMATDAAVHFGLDLAELSDATRAAMAAVLPPEASLANPVDMIASADAHKYAVCVEALLADPGVDALLPIFVAPSVVDPRAVAAAIADGVARGRARGGADKPVLVCFMRKGSHGAAAPLRDAGLPVYLFPEAAAKAMAAMARFGDFLRAPVGVEPTFEPPLEHGRAAEVIGRARARGGGWLPFAEVVDLLGAYGVPVVPWAIAASEEDAVAFGLAHGFPLVLKIDSDTILHRTEHKAVEVDLRSEADVRAAWRAIRSRLAGVPGEHRMLVQAMVQGGTEVLIGATVDPAFGPLIAFGLGGVFVELMRDVAFRLTPLTDVSARAMVASIRGYPILTGARGATPVDVEGLVDVLLRVGRLVQDHPEIVEIDLNPFFAHPDRALAAAADARVRVAGPALLDTANQDR